jgi:hypothetical protein
MPIRDPDIRFKNVFVPKVLTMVYWRTRAFIFPGAFSATIDSPTAGPDRLADRFALLNYQSIKTGICPHCVRG